MISYRAAALSALLFTTTSTNAQDTCSCSPTKFTFKLSLSQNCNTNDIASNSGIAVSYCFVDEGVTLPTPFASSSGTKAKTLKTHGNSMLGGILGGSVGVEDVVKDLERTNAFDDEPIRRSLQHDNIDNNNNSSNNNNVDSERQLQSNSGTTPPIEILSIQFLEFDTSNLLTVIHTDNSYTDTSLSNGDTVEFFSSSSFIDTSLDTLEEQMEYVPGGASLILYGRLENGDMVRNRFFWLYDMTCGEGSEESVTVEDGIGWVTVDETSGAWPKFCNSLPPNSTTISPRTNEPTYEPSEAPVMDLSPSPSVDNVGSGDGSSGDGGTKANKPSVDIDDGSKTGKNPTLSAKEGKQPITGYSSKSNKPSDDGGYDDGLIGSSSGGSGKSGKSKSSKDSKADSKSSKQYSKKDASSEDASGVVEGGYDADAPSSSYLFGKFTKSPTFSVTVETSGNNS